MGTEVGGFYDIDDTFGFNTPMPRFEKVEDVRIWFQHLFSSPSSKTC